VPRTVPVVVAEARDGRPAGPAHRARHGDAAEHGHVRSRVDGQLLSVEYKEGELVRQGDLLAQIDPRPFQVQLTQAEGQQAKDRAALQNAQADLARFTTLQEAGVLPTQQLDAQRATVRQLEAALQSDQGLVDAAKLNITYSRITAPIGGRVGLRLVDPGNMVHASDANGIVVITQLEPITVVFTLPADRLPQVLARSRAGQALSVTAFDRDMRRQLASGTLAAIDNQIDPEHGDRAPEGSLREPGRRAVPNQFVNASLLVDTLEGAVLVPAAGIQRSPQSTYAWVREARLDRRDARRGGRAHRGRHDRDPQGASAGDRVVTDGVDKLQDGTKVAAPRRRRRAAPARRRDRRATREPARRRPRPPRSPRPHPPEAMSRLGRSSSGRSRRPS
jgi:multidrug efflux system membrane fusion protein